MATATATAEKADHLAAAEKLVAKLPKAVREAATVEEGKGKYTLVKYGGRTVASVRSKNVRITIGHDGSAAAVGALAPAVAEAATSRPAVKTKEEREQEKEERKRKKEEEAKAKAEAQAEAEDEDSGGGE
jgi:hypothetical protein